MKKRVFFTDLDDTLLNREKEITPDNRAALELLRDQGHYISIATGRALPSGLEQAKRLGLDGEHCFIIAYNGSQIYSCSSKKLIGQWGLAPDTVRFVFDEAKKFGIHAQTYSHTGVIATGDNDHLRKYVDYQHLPYVIVEDVAAALEGPAPKVLIVDYHEPERVDRFRSYITPLLEGKADVFKSHPSLLEIVPSGINKGFSVRYLCDYLGLPVENSVAAGDAENDLTMMRAAHIGCAMCNGEETVRRAADYVTVHDCDHGGVAEILHRFILDDKTADPDPPGGSGREPEGKRAKAGSEEGKGGSGGSHAKGIVLPGLLLCLICGALSGNLIQRTAAVMASEPARAGRPETETESGEDADNEAREAGEETEDGRGEKIREYTVFSTPVQVVIEELPVQDSDALTPAAAMSPAPTAAPAAMTPAAAPTAVPAAATPAAAPTAAPAAATPPAAPTAVPLPTIAAVPVNPTGAPVSIPAETEGTPAPEQTASDNDPQVQIQESIAPTPVPGKLVPRTAEIIRKVQSALQKAGFPCQADGVFGPQTQGAIRSFQKTKGLAEDGEITWDLLTALGVFKEGVEPVPRKSREEIWKNASFDEELFDGNWLRMSGKADDPDYRVYVPKEWQTSGYFENQDTFALTYEDNSEDPEDFDLVCLRLIRPGPAADKTMEALQETALLYDGYGFSNTRAADCRVGDFEGMILYALEEEGKAKDLTCTFAGKNREGQVLVAGFSCPERSWDIYRRIHNILCSVRRS